MLCKHRINGKCDLAEQMAKKFAPDVEIEILCRDDAFEACTKAKEKYTKNHVSMSLLHTALKKAGKLSLEIANWLKPYLLSQKLSKEVQANILAKVLSFRGVGTELHTVLKERGWEVEDDCPCIPLMIKMNTEGIEWCRDNSRMIVDTMVKEWQRRNKFAAWVIPKWVAGIKAEDFIELAIQKYEQSQKVIAEIEIISG